MTQKKNTTKTNMTNIKMKMIMLKNKRNKKIFKKTKKKFTVNSRLFCTLIYIDRFSIYSSKKHSSILFESEHIQIFRFCSVVTVIDRVKDMLC